MTDKKKPSELWKDEFYEVDKVLKMGAEKYEIDDWLKEEGHVISPKKNHDSMFHHLAESFVGRIKDKESELHPLLHVACRALMGFTRYKRGLDYYDVPGLKGVTVNSKGLLKKNGEIAAVSLAGNGYLLFAYNGKRYYVHRLVMETFEGPLPEGLCTNHKDGNKENNSIENLEYVTYSENLKHAYDNGLTKPYDRNGENHPNNKLTQHQVNEIRELFKEFDLTFTEVARMYEVSRHTVSRIVRGKSWTKDERGLDNDER